jgi:hypothetical protein
MMLAGGRELDVALEDHIVGAKRKVVLVKLEDDLQVFSRVGHVALGVGQQRVSPALWCAAQALTLWILAKQLQHLPKQGLQFIQLF